MPEPESEKRLREMRTRASRFTKAEIEPYSGDVKTERSGKGIRYPEKHDRDSRRGF
jgi:hypothetical protein